MMSECRGLICVPMEGAELDRLALPQMVDDNTESMKTAFTVSVDASGAHGVTTGISAPDRATTIRLLTSPDAVATDFVRPGHVFPLRARDGGVLTRDGHTEAAVDLARLAGLRPAGAIVEIAGEDGRMLRLPELIPFARKHGLTIISIEGLIKYRRSRELAGDDSLASVGFGALGEGLRQRLGTAGDEATTSVAPSGTGIEAERSGGAAANPGAEAGRLGQALAGADADAGRPGRALVDAGADLTVGDRSAGSAAAEGTGVRSLARSAVPAEAPGPVAVRGFVRPGGPSETALRSTAPAEVPGPAGARSLVRPAETALQPPDPLVHREATTPLPTAHGTFTAYGYRAADGVEHVALVHGEIGDGEDVLVRLHSECLTGDVFGSQRCDCGPQLDAALERVQAEGRGVVVYLRGHEGRGIGLLPKLRAYELQEQGHDTLDANLELGLPADARDYGAGARILTDLGVRTVRLLTNNPDKTTALARYGLTVTAREAVPVQAGEHNIRYLRAKRDRMGHDLPWLEEAGGDQRDNRGEK
ncbi:MAG TPA: GTP cyclohydrolase II [Streptomyces sp.]